VANSDEAQSKKKEIQRSRLARTTFVPPTQEFLSSAPYEEAEASTVLCKDCKFPSTVESLVSVDALHVQCPRCLYVFFMDEAQRKALSGAGSSPVGMGAGSLRR
jgi:hypothetical protein